MIRALLFLSLLIPATALGRVSCESQLMSPMLKAFEALDYESQPESGFVLTHPIEAAAETRVLDISSYSPTGRVKAEIWRFEDHYFRFVDTGFKNLEHESNIVDQAILHHLAMFPKQNLKMIFGRDRMSARTLLYKYRWALHFAVLDVYRTKKKYLSRQDFQNLKAANLFSNNSDVFGLLDAGSSLPGQQDSQLEISQRLLLTLQISYPGERNFFRPTLKGLTATTNVEAVFPDDRLPFEYRLPMEHELAFREKFYQRFAKKSTCELTRYAKFQNIPQAVHDRFLYEALVTAVKRGMNVLVASGDPFTARLFQRYGFKIFDRLPTAQEKETEYLTYLEVNSPEFRNLVARLGPSGAATKIIDENYFD